MTQKIKRTLKEARVFAQLALEDYAKNKDQALFLQSLMCAVKWIGVSKVARKTGLTRQGIYDALNRPGANPSLKTLRAILDVLWVQMAPPMILVPRSRIHILMFKQYIQFKDQFNETKKKV